MKTIRREIMIAAPAAKVWEFLANSGRIAQWFLPNDFAPVVGHQFTLSCGHEGPIVCAVREVAPPTRLVYTFRAPEMPAETVVTFTLEDTAQGTRLTLLHSGWEELGPAGAALFGKFDQGWGGTFLPRLQGLFGPGH